MLARTMDTIAASVVVDVTHTSIGIHAEDVAMRCLLHLIATQPVCQYWYG